MISPRVIVFEGLDRGGKTSLCRAFAEVTGQVHTCLDRWIISCRVYDGFFGRHHDRYEINKWRTRLENDLIERYGLTVVLVDTEPALCVERGAEYTVQEMIAQRWLFEEQLKLLEERGATTLILPTSDGGVTLSEGGLAIRCRRALHI